jgi:hypothetical protein
MEIKFNELRRMENWRATHGFITSFRDNDFYGKTPYLTNGFYSGLKKESET